ncbi:MAG: hypothetical protein AAGH19_09790 [Pseudomonadota bacterium]
MYDRLSAGPNLNLCLLALSLFILAPSQLQAGVFGDDNPANGTEDDRRGISEGSGSRHGESWYRSGGTIYCDGAVRGSATLVAVTRRGAGRRRSPAGAVVATAAHVFYDLETNHRWRQCEFLYLGLGALPGYRATIAANHVLFGGFDPNDEPSRPTSGAGDWAFAWLGETWVMPPGAEPMSIKAVRAQTILSEGLGLLAWNRSAGELAVSSDCQAIRSRHHDLGGGSWSGQLLDDCDSSLGASGGGLIIQQAAQSHLIGIRGGHHWDGERWPASVYPEGPPDGLAWNPSVHTNYARAIDEGMLAAFARWWWTLRVGPPSSGQADFDAPDAMP